jgi:hypothetical protein
MNSCNFPPSPMIGKTTIIRPSGVHSRWTRCRIFRLGGILLVSTRITYLSFVTKWVSCDHTIQCFSSEISSASCSRTESTAGRLFSLMIHGAQPSPWSIAKTVSEGSIMMRASMPSIHRMPNLGRYSSDRILRSDRGDEKSGCSRHVCRGQSL